MIEKMLRLFLFLLFIPLFFVTNLFAEKSQLEFMTTRDLLTKNIPSGINLRNNRNSAATVYGIYIRQFSLVTPGNSCDSATLIYSTTKNTTAGSVVTPVMIKSGNSAAVGSNYLYNMIYNAEYYVTIIFPVSPPGCILPGCTWGTDTTQYNWCIFLGALAPVSTTAGYTANVPPSTTLASSVGVYNYDLVNNYVMLGPISCNDQTLTCTVANQQTQSFS